ncbi:hypothetical protein C8R47DRAFT_1064270 [Mycena vitilis]|nr:hypothetical protein C8R47DRAFT_1064270 [Mycena vitilis]
MRFIQLTVLALLNVVLSNAETHQVTIVNNCAMGETYSANSESVPPRSNSTKNFEGSAQDQVIYYIGAPVTSIGASSAQPDLGGVTRDTFNRFVSSSTAQAGRDTPENFDSLQNVGNSEFYTRLKYLGITLGWRNRPANGLADAGTRRTLVGSSLNLFEEEGGYDMITFQAIHPNSNVSPNPTHAVPLTYVLFWLIRRSKMKIHRTDMQLGVLIEFC